MEELNYKKVAYVMKKPTTFNKNERYPLVIFLHGAGGRAASLEYLHNHEFFKLATPFCSSAVLVAPKCSENSWFNLFERLQELAEMLSKLPFIDPTRVYLIGNSMGGYATWQLAMSKPELFAGIVPICGGGMYWNGAQLKNMGVWAFHGSEDKIVRVEESVKMVESIQKHGGNAKITIYQGVEHNAWSRTFANEKMWDWLFSLQNQYASVKDEYTNAEKFG